MPQETHAFPTSAVHSRPQQARGTATTQAAPPNARVFIDSDACDPGGHLLLALVHPLWRRHCPRVEVESALQQLLVIGSARDATGVTPKQRRGNTTHTHTTHTHHTPGENKPTTSHHTPHTTHHTPHTTHHHHHHDYRKHMHNNTPPVQTTLHPAAAACLDAAQRERGSPRCQRRRAQTRMSSAQTLLQPQTPPRARAPTDTNDRPGNAW